MMSNTFNRSDRFKPFIFLIVTETSGDLTIKGKIYAKKTYKLKIINPFFVYDASKRLNNSSFN
jgi:hypothetical protein